jgi:hypothetical protein
MAEFLGDALHVKSAQLPAEDNFRLGNRSPNLLGTGTITKQLAHGSGRPGESSRPADIQRVDFGIAGVARKEGRAVR